MNPVRGDGLEALSKDRRFPFRLGAWGRLLRWSALIGCAWIAVDWTIAAEAVREARGSSGRNLTIVGDRAGISRASVSGPEFRAPQILLGAEDFHHPRIRRLREEYRLNRVVRGEPDEFRRILKLRHWVHTRWPIDNAQNFSGDAFAILEKARTGAGFHCSHAMTVQHAVMSSMGYVSRYVLVDRNHTDLGRSLHHGVDEVWSNDHAKWVLLDAKYDVHFERGGIPLSALELHDAVRADGGRGVVMVRGVDRQPVPMRDAEAHEASVRSYWWVAYPFRPSPFTLPDFGVRERLVVWDNEAWRTGTWYRDHGQGLAPHWAYAAGAFVPVGDRSQIEWTPGVVDVRVRRTAPAELEVEVRTATPNLQDIEVRADRNKPRFVSASERVRWQLRAGENRLVLRTRNLFGVLGPPLEATVVYSTP